MISKLAQWILSGRRQRRPRRGTRPQQFHVERLETRTVLSASIGTAPVEFETPDAVAACEAVADQSAWQPPLALSGAAEAHWEDAPSHAFDSPPPNLPRFDRPDLIASFGGWHGPQAPSRVVYGITYSFQNTESPANPFPQTESQQLAKSQLDQSGENRPPLMATFPSTQPNESPPDRPMRFESVPSFANLAAATTSATTTTTRSTSPETLQAHDTAFQDYSIDRLLLAMNLEDASDADTDDADDDPLASAENADDELDALAATLDDGADASLDVLSRERRAIDAVLAELHELDPAEVVPKNDAATNPPSHEMPYDFEAELAAAAAAQNAQPAASDAGEGGMVWLVPTGDANSSAFDLTGVFLSGLPTAPQTALGMEASLGIYQAFDVGTTESLPATANAQPTAAPATALRPSVSAESNAVKHVEQPS